ncbi:hypothetical protein TRIUR3_33746 [Triticum urartu]|uniref:Vacuolar protein sorting-associated protein 29 n=1 Tax=Triticum urartu TaxID=4572 RepID=M7ZEH8_TRIUA|nr:hypothetical protein TRIUR3_33746 [Triticum urartu]
MTPLHLVLEGKPDLPMGRVRRVLQHSSLLRPLKRPSPIRECPAPGLTSSAHLPSHVLSPTEISIARNPHEARLVVPWGDLDSLAMLQRQLDVDILVTGHTHQFKAYKHEGGVVINPGSGTGAHSSITYDVNPSFVLMDIDGLRVVVYVYELIDGEVKVDKIDFKKTATMHG